MVSWIKHHQTTAMMETRSSILPLHRQLQEVPQLSVFFLVALMAAAATGNSAVINALTSTHIFKNQQENKQDKQRQQQVGNDVQVANNNKRKAVKAAGKASETGSISNNDSNSIRNLTRQRPQQSVEWLPPKKKWLRQMKNSLSKQRQCAR